MLQRLYGCFECTNWSMFLEDGSSLDAATDMISSYINFCTDMYLETKEVKLHQNSKP